MTQTEARRKAQDLKGIAVEARPRKNGGWLIGGWPNQKESTWIVVSPSKRVVLAD